MVERGELVVPNMADCFPVAGDAELAAMTEAERRLYWQTAMDQGLGSRLIPKHFTTVGKMKVIRCHAHYVSRLKTLFHHSLDEISEPNLSMTLDDVSLDD